MPWWGWIIVGAILLGAELVVDAQFYLVFLGVSAAVVGLAGLGGLTLPAWGQWLVFAALAIVTMVGFRRRLYERVRRSGAEVEKRLTVGDRVVVPERLEPGHSCRVDYHGSTWTARNAGERTIEPGAEAEIFLVDGLTLHVRQPSGAA